MKTSIILSLFFLTTACSGGGLEIVERELQQQEQPLNADEIENIIEAEVLPEAHAEWQLYEKASDEPITLHFNFSGNTINSNNHINSGNNINTGNDYSRTETSIEQKILLAILELIAERGDLVLESPQGEAIELTRHKVDEVFRYMKDQPNRNFDGEGLANLDGLLNEQRLAWNPDQLRLFMTWAARQALIENNPEFFEEDNTFEAPPFNYCREQIEVKANQLEAQGVDIGRPENETDIAGTHGCQRHYERGAIYWHRDYGANALINEFYGDSITREYNRIGQYTSELGFPITDSRHSADGIGYEGHFEYGSIYGKLTTGLYMSLGRILAYWHNHGGIFSDFGYPISPQVPVRPGAAGFVQDYENGVLYWRPGDAQAREIPAADFATITSDEVVEDITTAIQNFLNELNATGDEEISIDSDPYLASVTTDYKALQTFEQLQTPNITTYNRRHHIKTRLEIDAEFKVLGLVDVAPNPKVDLDLWFAFGYDREQEQVTVTLTRYEADADVDWPTSESVSEGEIEFKIETALAEIKDVAMPASQAQEGVTIFAAKTVANGDVHIHLQLGEDF